MFLGGCPCCGKKECWYCWTQNGPPGNQYRECGTTIPGPSFEWSTDGVCHATESECNTACISDIPVDTWYCLHYYKINSTVTEPFYNRDDCPPEDSPLVVWVNASKGNIVKRVSDTPDSSGDLEYNLCSTVLVECVDASNPPNPPADYDFDSIGQGGIGDCPSDADQLCVAQWNRAGSDIKASGVAYHNGGPQDGNCSFFFARSEYNEIVSSGESFTPFEYCAECRDGTTKEEPVALTAGPGTQLANLLKWFGIKAKEKGCGCKSMQKKMDKGGPQWCRQHKDEILDHLAKEAKKRGLPFVKLAALKLLGLAIRRAEKKS